MKLAHAADLHLGHRQYGLKQRAKDAELSFRYFLGQAEAADVDAILVPGDFFDSRDVRPKTLERAEDALESIETPIIVSSGNHDQNISRRRELTWLQYLNNRGYITLLGADFGGGDVTFAPTDTDDPREDGAGYVDLDGPDGPVRVFGLQYRGAYLDAEIPDVAAGIRAVNDEAGEPAGTVLLAHFGVDDVVPDLGANVSYAAMEPLEDVCDYIALGHIHRQYETQGCAKNPGSLEAFTVEEGRWDDEHGYYIVETDTWDATFHAAKRRPYYTVEFDVSDYRTFGDLRADFEETVRDARAGVERVCERGRFRTGDGGRRAPIVNVRFTGTLLLDHTAFDLEELSRLAETELDALYVQPTDNTERKAVQEMLGELDRNEAFEADGTVNTDALQERVFTTLAEESRYSARADAVADVLDELERQVTEEGHGPEQAASYLREMRRNLFPEGIGVEATVGGDSE